MKKRRLLSMIIAVIMLLTQMSTAAFAEEGLEEVIEQMTDFMKDGQKPALEEGLFVASPSSAEPETYLSGVSEVELLVATPSNAESEAHLSGTASGTALTPTSGVLTSGEYYLEDDLQLEKCLEINKDVEVTIDLNGHVLDGKKLTKGADRGALYVAAGGTLTITDSASNDTEHYFKVESTGKWTLTTKPEEGKPYYIYQDGQLTAAGAEGTYEGIPEAGDVIMVKGGCVTGGHGFDSKLEDKKMVGGAVYSWGKLTLDGVNIVGNTADKGGAVYNTPDAEMTATDVHFIGNYAEQQGAGVFNKGTTTKNTISGYISYNTAQRYGAGVSSTGEVEIKDCSITHNVISNETSNYGAGMDWWGGKLKLSGTVVIADNVNVKSKNHSDNLFLEYTNDSDDVCLTVDDSFVSDSVIYVGHSLTATRNNIQIASCPEDYSKCFQSDVDGYTARFVDNSKINLVYKDCYVKSTGSDGDYKANRALGSYSSPLTLKNAIGYCAYYGVSTILLEDSVTLTDRLIVPSGIEIKTDGKGKIVKLGNNGSITFKIKNEADLIHANTVSEYGLPGFTATWDMEDNIVLSDNIFSKRNITIKGNGYSISGSQDAETEYVNHVLSFKSTTTDGIQININDLKVEVLDGFRGGIYFATEEGCFMNAALTDVSVKADRTKAPQKGGEEKTGTLIQINGGNLTVKGDFNAKTDKYCWSAIDLDDGTREAKLTFDSKVSAAFTDGRTDLLRAKEPFIGLDIQVNGKGASVENAVNAGLERIESGAEVTVRDIREKREKSGYDLIEYQITFDANGGTGSMESVRTLDKKLVLPENKFSPPTGMVFKGWIVGQSSSVSVAPGTEVTFTQATTIYAKWRDESNVLYGINWWNSTDSGWVIKPGTGDWYVVKDNALVKGWYRDSEDGRWYYLDPATGKMMTGWVTVDGKWYYLNPVASAQTWFKGTDGKWYYDKSTKARPYGSMYCNETTPDGYRVDENGARK